MRVRFEHTRYFIRDRVARGLDFGCGALVQAGRDVLTRGPAPSTMIRTRDLEGSAGLSLNTRLRRWQRFRAEAATVAGIVLGRTSETHEIDAASGTSESGGGWRLEALLSAGVKVSGATWLTASYRGTGQIRYASHRGVSERRNQFIVGVSHGR